MIYKHNEISDDEIRIISGDDNKPKGKKQSGPKFSFLICIVAAIAVIGALAVIFPRSAAEPEIPEPDPETPEILFNKMTRTDETSPKAFVERRDTVVNGLRLVLLTPRNATPTLEIGTGVQNDTTAVLVAQAADVRQDNGGIVGSFVMKGDLVSKGEAKAGFCSIVNGEITVGVADATPAFEQALTSGGYFFRQFPLVVGEQVVENKPKGRSMRRALAETADGSICVILSGSKATFSEFSQALVDAGVKNAIYLVGGSAYGRYTGSNGQRRDLGRLWSDAVENVNYIVWR